MKNYQFLIIIATTLFLTSCEKTNSERVDLNTTPEIEVVDGMLSFTDQITFDETVDYLFKMGYNYSLNWCDSLGFVSMNNVYDIAFDEVDQISTEEEYYEFRSVYSGILLFNEVVTEDLSFYLPLSNRSLAPVLNISGDVLINGEVYNFKDLEELNENYLKTRNVLKSTNDEWCYVSTSKRKYWSHIGASTSYIWTEVNAQKKFLFGWINYRTTYGLVVRIANGWTSSYSLNTIHTTGKLPSGSVITLGSRNAGSSYSSGKLEQWSGGVGYNNRCTNVTFYYD